MKILIEGRPLLGPTGIGVYSRSLLSGLRDEGHKVRVLSRPREAYRIAKASGSVPVVRRSDWKFPTRCDIAHGFDFRPVPLNLPRATHVITFHDASAIRFPELFPPGHSETVLRDAHRAAQLGAYVVADSTSAARDCVDLMGFEPVRVSAVLLGVDEIWTTTPRQVDGRGKPYVLTVGALVKRKRVTLLLEAWKILRESGYDISFKHVGPVPSDEWRDGAVARWLDAHPQLVQHIEFAGPASDSDLISYVDNASLLACASQWEGFGLTLPQAQRRSIPVVTVDNSSLREASGNLAIYVDEEPESLAAGMQSALKVDESRLKLAREWANTLTWAQTVKGTVAAYQAAIDG